MAFSNSASFFSNNFFKLFFELFSNSWEISVAFFAYSTTTGLIKKKDIIVMLARIVLEKFPKKISSDLFLFFFF